MARGRKKKVAAKGNGATDPSTSKFKFVGPETRDGEMYFSAPDLSLYELAQYKLRSAAQAARIKQHEADDYQRKANQKLAALQLQKKALDEEAAKRKATLIEMQEAITELYGVDLSKVTYDDETGRITEPPPDAAEPQPAA